jgi:hypothetical protein
MGRKKLFRKNFGAIILIIMSILVAVVFGSTSAEASGEDEIVLNFSFQEPEITVVNISNTTHHRVTIQGSPTIGGIGLPLLPIKPLKVLFPQKGMLESINVTYEGNTSLGDGYKVLLGNESSNLSGQQNESNFDTSIPYPTGLFYNGGTHYLRGYSILVFNLYPVHFIGNTGEIYYYKNMTVTITTKGTGSVHPLFRGFERDEILMKQIVNDHSRNYTYDSYPDSPGNSSLVDHSDSYDFVIITKTSYINASPFPPVAREWYTLQDLD